MTDTSARSEVAVAASGTAPRSGVPGSPSETATPLKTGEAATVVGAWSELADEGGLGTTDAAREGGGGDEHGEDQGALHRGTAAASTPASRHSPTMLISAISPAGRPTIRIRRSRRPSAASAKPDVGDAGAHARLLALGEREGPRVGGLVGVALGAEHPAPELVAGDLGDPVRDEARGAGVGRRAVGDDVADAQLGDRDDLVEHERAAVVGARHRAARDDVALPAERGRQPPAGAPKSRPAASTSAEQRACDAAGHGEASGDPPRRRSRRRARPRSRPGSCCRPTC